MRFVRGTFKWVYKGFTRSHFNICPFDWVIEEVPSPLVPGTCLLTSSWSRLWLQVWVLSFGEGPKSNQKVVGHSNNICAIVISVSILPG